MAETPGRPRDPNQLAQMVVAIATGETTDSVPSASPMADIGRTGGEKGGKARAETLSPERRSEIAKRAAQSRWNKAT